jgi:hypothetical protein
MEQAVARMADLIREGMAPAKAAGTAAAEYGLEASEVARLCAARAVGSRESRHAANRMTQAEGRAFLREHLVPRTKVDRDCRRAAAVVFMEIVASDAGAPRGAAAISNVYREETEDLDPEQQLIVQHELIRLWKALPPELDPREFRRSDLPRDNWLFKLLEDSAFYKWVPRG